MLDLHQYVVILLYEMSYFQGLKIGRYCVWCLSVDSVSAFRSKSAVAKEYCPLIYQ